MKINNLKLQNWRNHLKFEFEFDGITVLVGDNASGKTNFLEAIYYLACGRSFRTKDENLVMWEKEFGRLEGYVEKEDGPIDLVVLLDKKVKTTKTVMIKGQKAASSKLLGKLNCVLFTPEEIDLISTLPEARRRYLNMIISQSDIHYAYNLIHFRRTLEQRNRLLKRISLSMARESELEVWDGKFAEYAEDIIIKRSKYVREINKYISDCYEKLSQKKQILKLIYNPDISETEGWAGIVSKLTQSRSRDILSKFTSTGPHRDDFTFRIDGREVSDFASRGEFRTVILALKLAEVEYFKSTTGETPVLLLDDVFSELDQTRRDLLSQIFVDQQTIITTTDLDHVSENIVKIAKIVSL